MLGSAGTLYVVDLPPTITLPWTQQLNRMGLIVVPVIQRWCTASAILACDGLVNLLVQQGAIVQLPSEPRGAVVLLDGDRAGPAPRRRTRLPLQAFDNRHPQHVDSLPPAAFLRAEGLTRVVFLTSHSPAGDLAPYLTGLREAELPVEVAALARVGR